MFEETLSLAHRLDGTDDAWQQQIFEEIGRATTHLGEAYFLFGKVLGEVRFDGISSNGVGGALERLCAEMPRSPPRLRAALAQKGSVCRLAELPFESEPGAPYLTTDEYLEQMGLSRDYWMVSGIDIQGNGFIVGIDFARSAGDAERRALEALSLAARHVGAAWRLRRAITIADDRSDAGALEAVLEPSGRLVHAEGLRLDQDMRTTLAGATRALTQRRDRSHDPLARLLAQRVLVAGRWSLIDHTDTDGRRLVLARVNDPQAPAAVLSMLSHRERQVAMWLALGATLKEIAYELGLAVSTVHGCEQRARRKLGVTTRAGLLARVHLGVEEALAGRR